MKGWGDLAGMVCTCPVGCTDKIWGDAGKCSPDCKPCKHMAGEVYTPPFKPRAGR